MRPWHVRECHNCVIVPATSAAAVCIINTCGHSGEPGVTLTSHKMEKTDKRIGKREGWPLLISCLCTESCFIKTLQPAVSLIFTDRHQGEEREAIFFSFIFYCSSFTANRGCAQRAVKAAAISLVPLLISELRTIQQRSFGSDEPSLTLALISVLMCENREKDFYLTSGT